MRVQEALVRFKGLWISLLIVLLPLWTIFVVSPALYVVLVMAGFWALAPIPIYISSLFPLVLAPVLRILPADRVASFYWNDAIVLFLGSFMLSRAFEVTNLHRRIALKICLVCGNRPRLLLAGFCSCAAFLSMWMSNTSTAALMVPLVMPIVEELDAADEGAELNLEEGSADMEEVSSSQEMLVESRSNQRAVPSTPFSKSLLLGIAYSCSIGGTCTLVGTGPNVVLVSTLVLLFPEFEGLSFGVWMVYAIPVAVAAIGFLWLILVFVLNRNAKTVTFDMARYVEDYQNLGKLRVDETITIVLFVILAVLWLTRPLWSGPLFHNYVRDGTVCLLLTLNFFIIPAWKKPILSQVI
jgi:sodium-dependent dicarboxylate transporter 2/3/5